MAEKKYIRLTRERGPAQFSISAMARSSLWVGEDHLLLVECTGYSESYKRFFFRDIQAFTMRRTKSRMIWNWVWGSLLGIGAVITFAVFSEEGLGTAVWVLSCIFGVCFGIPLVLNNLFGPTCACEIRTAVQTEALSSLCRVRKTEKVMNRIRPLIIAAQGQLTAEEVAMRMRETVSPSSTTWSGDLPPVIS